MISKYITIALQLFICLTLSFPSFSEEISREDSLRALYDFAPDEPDSVIAKRMEAIDSEIPLTFNSEVRVFIDYFTLRKRDYMRLMLKRQSAYFPIFEAYLKKDSLPEALKYLTIVESGMNPKALSHAGALGLWQFMPSTGKMFGLDGDWYIDERRDPFKATQAATQYLEQLYGMFEDWELALAAYNCGPGNVRRAIRRSGYKKTFWEIYPYLPRETRSYVPQFMAVIYVMNYADEHNLYIEDHDIEHFPEFETVTVNQYVNLDEFAECLYLCSDEIISLNPEIKRNVIPSHLKSYDLRIPKKSYSHFLSQKDEILTLAAKKGDERLNYPPKYSASSSTDGKNRIVYTVRSGDVLGSIAQRYHVKLSDLRVWNGMRGDMIRVGQKLYIYKDPSYFKSTPPTQTVAKKTESKDVPNGKIYTVQPGDTLWGISQKFNDVSVEDIKRLNNLKSNALQPGQKLKLG